MRAAIAAALMLATASGADAFAAEAPTGGHPILQVQLGPQIQTPVSGRLLVFAQPLAAAKAAAKDGKVTRVEPDPFGAEKGNISAREVATVQPGAVIDIDLDGVAAPQAFSQLPPGDYAVQAVLDQNHSYNYNSRGPGDLVSPVVELKLPLAAGTKLTLETIEPATDPWNLPASVPEQRRALRVALRPHAHEIAFVSPALSAFWGRPITLKGWVVTPPGYEAGKDRYPTVYYTTGFGGTANSLVGVGASVFDGMAKGRAPPMIWVLLDESSATGTHEFADGVNNGPWGTALTEELIPDLEKHWRMDAKAGGRFLNGHSSGGWATLWLQTRYPKVFGGTWSTSPDPSDFHDFSGVDLYAAGANIYFKPDGSTWPIARDKGKVLASSRDATLMEEALGEYGGQMRSFDWVFSPRGPDGRPMPLFDRATGAVDPVVAAYWRDHYDIAEWLKRDWPALKPDLDGKVHLIVGAADTFYLDGAAHRLEAVMKGLGAKTDFRYLEGRTHFDLYVIGDDDRALLDQIAWEMYAIARPGAKPPVAAAKPGG
ncbi:enterochelin esterase [Caulobacter sp. Root655]|uniref:alpha/beta hydrolase n=1 Tax=Caulobacter sp. Root655 TaxID=1736578 RepID=UPI0006FEB798|nr:alpha/beta hydrolase-fold protein [Caulobacter sp. Root655]KRA61851.1 enterochelin esterase [Caulobacter sp. Root655]